MGLIERLNNDMKDAMKAKDKERLSVIRLLKSSLQKEQIEMRRDLSEDEELTILSRELKQRKESVTEFKKANRQDLVDKSLFEIKVVEYYMPKQLSHKEVEQIVLDSIQQTDSKTLTDFGKVMKDVMPKLKGKADGNIVNQIVKSLLAK